MATTVEDLVEVTTLNDTDLLHIRETVGNQDNKMSWENMKKAIPSVGSEYIGSISYFATYKDRSAYGLLPFAFDNAISQANYPVLYAEIGDIYEAQHVAAGDSASGAGMFYPTPVPGAYDRVGIPDQTFTETDVDTANDRIANLTGYITSIRDGSPMMFIVESGTAPTTTPQIVTDTIYYGRFGDGFFNFYPTEADAVAGTNKITISAIGSGTFRLTQEGIVLDHAVEDSDITLGANGDSDNTRPSGQSSAGTGLTTGTVKQSTFFTGNFTNETRPKTNYSFGYIKAEHVTSAGEPISALRDSQDWVEFTGDWTNKEFVITPDPSIGYSSIDDVYDLQIEVWFADNDTPTNPVKIVTLFRTFDQAVASNLDEIYGVGIMPNTTSSFKLQTGANGIKYLSESGNLVSLGAAATGAYKVIIIKSNLINTVFDVSNMPKTYDLTSADVEVSLPARSGVLQTRDIFWTNGDGTYKLTIREHADDGGALLDYEGEGEGNISLTASSTAWEVKVYEDYLTDTDQKIWKQLDGTEIQEIKLTHNSAVDTGSGSIFRSSITSAVTRSHTFNSISDEQFSLFSAAGAILVWLSHAGTDALTTATGRIYMIQATTDATARDYIVIFKAIGRWKA